MTTEFVEILNGQLTKVFYLVRVKHFVFNAIENNAIRNKSENDILAFVHYYTVVHIVRTVTMLDNLSGPEISCY